MTSHLSIECILMYVVCLTFTASVSDIEMRKSPFGPLMCDRLCHHTVGCVYFFYTPHDLTCYLGNTSTALDRDALKMTASKIVGNTFKDISKCSRNSKTFQSRSKQLICLQQNERRNTISKETVKCGEAPVVPGARKNIMGYFPGDVTTYTCNPDYTPCHNKTTSVCQSTGEWVHVNGLCGQFRWHKAEKTHRLPCGPVDRFMVTVLGTLSKTDIISLHFNEGDNLLFHLHFEISFKVATVNSKLHDKWQSANWINDVPLTVDRNCNISIRLQYGTYKVFVDHTLIVNYSEPIPGVNPELLQIVHWNLVKLVEFTP